MDDESFDHLSREQTPTARRQQQNRDYLKRLQNQLNQWVEDNYDHMKDFVQFKLRTISRHFEEYNEAMGHKYSISPSDRSTGDGDHNSIESPTDRIERHLKVVTTLMTNADLEDKIRIEYQPVTLEPIVSSLRPSANERKPSVRKPSESITGEQQEPISHATHAEENKHPLQTNTENRNQSAPFVLSSRFRSSSRNEPTTTTTTTTIPSGQSQLHAQPKDVFIPVLLDKDREGRINDEHVTRYFIDSLMVPSSNRYQRGDQDESDDKELVRGYQRFLQRQLSPSHVEPSTVHNRRSAFHLQQFDHSNYSTILLKQFQSDFHCLGSSTRRNELVVFNEKFHVLLILQHESNQQCRQRFYLEWPESVANDISDISYSDQFDRFFFSSLKSKQIFSFDRELLLITPINLFEDNVEIRRLHCDGQTMFCILGKHDLIQYQSDHGDSRFQQIRRIQLRNHTGATLRAPVLIDVSCDDQHIVVLYSLDNDAVRLQVLNRDTLQLDKDFQVDDAQPISRKAIRIERGKVRGHYVYLNSSKRTLKSINLANQHDDPVTSEIRRNSVPTNVSFLHDGRLVILYNDPYHFLSVHHGQTPQQSN